MNFSEEAIILHREKQGKIEVISKVPLENSDDLSTAYTPGVAEPCRVIEKNPNEAYSLTSKGNLVAVVTDGTAVLGLGDIGPLAAMPVMEGKAVLFKKFGNVDAFPICLDTTDVDEIVKTVKNISPTFGGINLEDIAAPRCFEIEERLKAELDIPVFHDDQHGTAVVCVAGIMNALKLVDKKIETISAVINGAGAAGIAIARLLLKMGIGDIILCDRSGAIYSGRDSLGGIKSEMAEITNKSHKKGSLAEIISDTDIFIGVSAPNVLTKEMVATMAKDSIVFAMANPVPEIYPDEAKLGGAKVIGTGRSDFPNQVNNVLAFPGIFRGAFDACAREINDEMKIAAAEAIASLISKDELNPDYIIPKPFDERVAMAVATAVRDAAINSGICDEKIRGTING